MDTQGREESERRFKRQRSGFLQRSESGETGVKSSATQGRQQARLLLRPYEGDESEINERRNRKGSRFED